MSTNLQRFTLTFWLCFMASVSGISLAQDALSGTVTLYPENYYNPDLYPEAAAEVEALMAEYQELHPDVTVELVPQVPTGTNYVTWLTTRLAAGQAPNIAWQQFYDRNREGSDVWVPLNEYLEQPNPYVPAGQPGSERWGRPLPQLRHGADACGGRQTGTRFPWTGSRPVSTSTTR
jgi:ABC-type glycerol-3-phosphate transport system substrate-binding protein